MANPNRLVDVSSRVLGVVGGIAGIGSLALTSCAQQTPLARGVDGRAGLVSPSAKPSRLTSPSTTAVAVETPFSAPTDGANPPGIAAENALMDAAKNLAGKTHEDQNVVYERMRKIFSSLPNMSHLAGPREGLMPGLGTTVVQPESKNQNQPSYTTNVDAGGYAVFTTSYADMTVDYRQSDSAVKMKSYSLPWKKDDARIIFVMGATDAQSKVTVGLSDYPAGHVYTANAKPDEYQTNRYGLSDKSIYPVWLADQITQAISGASSQGIGAEQTVTVSFVNPKTQEVSEYVYDIKANTWSVNGKVVPAAGFTAKNLVEAPAPTPTTADALKDAAKNLAATYGMSEQDAAKLIAEAYNSLPTDMPFMAQANHGLMPHAAQGMSIMQPASKDVNNPSATLNAAEHGFQTFSGGYLTATVDGKWKLELPSQQGVHYNVYFVGKESDKSPTDLNTNIGLVDYLAKYNFTTGASPDKGQEDKYPNRNVLEPLWVAKGAIQAKLDNASVTTVKEVFIDTQSGRAVVYTFDLATKTWTKAVLPLSNLK